MAEAVPTAYRERALRSTPFEPGEPVVIWDGRGITLCIVESNMPTNTVEVAMVQVEHVRSIRELELTKSIEDGTVAARDGQFRNK